ncbi:hypothetical protein HMPREF9418_1519 [Neisseria macacae ATCC 33926]|uniref:Uncharacterized protein n=1 Tax=Neisseria macacae ATCC 33926 TaxID=997348 RepID=A0AA36XKS0_9NEIS|nr:hypothetical protein HMPREF9418_1519 [Neisseria macacae ATCC 33926]
MQRGRLKSPTAQKAIGILSLLCPFMSIEVDFFRRPLAFSDCKISITPFA